MPRLVPAAVASVATPGAVSGVKVDAAIEASADGTLSPAAFRAETL